MLLPQGNPQKDLRKFQPRYKCKCISHCTKFNRASNTYEGDGFWISRSTRQRHRDEDRYMRHMENKRRTEPAFQYSTTLTWLNSIMKEIKWLADLPVISATSLLIFEKDPSQNEHADDEAKMLVLKENSYSNSCFLFVQKRYQVMIEEIQRMPSSDDGDDAAGQIMDALDDLDKQKRLEWDRQNGFNHLQYSGRTVVNTDHHFRRCGPSQRIVRAACITSVVLQNLHFVPRRALRIHLRGIRGIIRATGESEEVINSIPLDPRTCSSFFDLNPEVRQYVSCPQCHCLYLYHSGQSPEEVPICTYQKTPASPQCETELWRERQLTGNVTISVPRRKYYHQNLKAWIGRLLSRIGMEDLLDRPYTPPDNPNLPIDDIWYSRVFRNLKDANGDAFYPSQNGECRLVFGLACDGFLPLHTDTQTVSSTGIWMVLYNLPVHMRYLPQNVYLAGVIPAPEKPSKDELNHYTQLVVDDLKEFWGTGVFFTRTYKYRSGRQCQGMLVPVICDHPGLRQIIGYASGAQSHYMCTGCDLDSSDIHVHDRDEWPIKDPEDVRRFASLWRDAPSEPDQNAIFEACGWRWSPLLDLPYWDPVVYSVVDTMHALDLNLFKNHCRSLFLIDTEHRSGDRSSALLKPQSQERMVINYQDDTVQKCRKTLKANSPTLFSKLLEFKASVLYTISVMYHIVEPERTQILGTRYVLARSLFRWRLSLEDASILHAEGDAEGGDDNDEDDQGNLPEFVKNMTGSNRTKAYRVIKNILSGNSSRLTASRREATLELLKHLCEALSIDIDGKNTKESRHNAIIAAVTENASTRKSLLALLPTAQRSRASVTLSDSEPGETDTEDDTDTEERSDAEEVQQPVQRSSVLSKQLKALIRRVLLIDNIRETPLPSAAMKTYEEALEILGIDKAAINRSSQTLSKKDVHAEILMVIDNNQEKYDLFSSLVPSTINDAILGKEVMNMVWDDMKRTRIPSWMSPAPANWGTAKRGTLSASNWQVICTIHLPVTLIWLWRDEDGRKKELLSNFMDLVTASKLAYLRTSSPAQIAAFDHHITRYVSNIRRLYPSEKLKPTHHTALHITDMMRDFGPDHARNARFYERYILYLHRIGINNKFGEMEQTFLKFSAQYSNVCAILSDDEQLRKDMAEMIEGIESIKKEDLRGYELASVLDPTQQSYTVGSKSSSVSLTDDVAAALIELQESEGLRPCSREISSVTQISQSGVRYAAFNSRHFRDSYILFTARSGADESGKKAGIIQLIFAQSCQDESNKKSTEIFLVVDEHVPITSRGITDPYREYGIAAGYLCDIKPSIRHVIKLTAVVCHFASTEIAHTEYLHVLPVDRLMYELEADLANETF